MPSFFGSSHPQKQILQAAVDELSRYRRHSLDQGLLLPEIEAGVRNIIEALRAKEGLVLDDQTFLKLMKYYFGLPDCSRNKITLGALLKNEATISDSIRKKFAANLVIPFDAVLLNFVADLNHLACYIEKPRLTPQQNLQNLAQEVEVIQARRIASEQDAQQKATLEQVQQFLRLRKQHEEQQIHAKDFLESRCHPN